MRLLVIGASAMLTFLMATPGYAQDELPIPSCIASTLDGNELLSRLVPTETQRAHMRQLRGIVRRALAWPTGTAIKVCFRSGTDIARQRIAEIAREWMEHANLTLDFGEGNPLRQCVGEPSEDIKIDFVDSTGWWSNLGTHSRKREHSMNFAYFGADAPTHPNGRAFPAAQIRRVVLHEFGHALGLVHEHQSPSAACEEEFDWEKAYEVGARIGWDKQKVDINYRQLLGAEEYNFTEVDRKSIMHYQLPADVFKRGTLSPCWVAANYELSIQDRAFIGTIYPKKAGPLVVASGPETSTARGKSASGGPGELESGDALVRQYEQLLRETGIEFDKANRLVEQFRGLTIGR